MWKTKEYKGNNKNQVVSEYVWMIYDPISDFLHPTTEKLRKFRISSCEKKNKKS